MTEFLSDLTRHAFLQYALLTGVLAGIACGIVGTYVVTRRIASVAGAIAHSILGGMGAARYCQVVLDWQWFHPLIGAVLAAIISAVIISWVRIAAQEREDTVIGAVWAIGMAVGLLFIFRTPGYNEDLMSYLFGSILMVTPEDLWLIGGLDALVVVLGLAFYNKFLAVCFDEEFTRIRGIRVEVYHTLLLCLTALTVVLLVTVVGIVMGSDSDWPVMSAAAQACAEFGVSVLSGARGRGYGARLFDRAMMHARNEGVSLMFVHVLSENTAMLKIARNAGATVERDGSESQACLRMPPATLDSRMTEIVEEHLAQTDYRLKLQAKQFWSFLADVQDIRQGAREAQQKLPM